MHDSAVHKFGDMGEGLRSYNPDDEDVRARLEAKLDDATAKLEKLSEQDAES